MNDTQLGDLIEFLASLRTKLNNIWKDDYDVEITLADSSSGDYYNIRTHITVPKKKEA